MVSEQTAARAAATDILLQRLVAELERLHPGLVDRLATPARRPDKSDEDETRLLDFVDSHISRILGNAAGQVYGGGSVA